LKDHQMGYAPALDYCRPVVVKPSLYTPPRARLTRLEEAMRALCDNCDTRDLSRPKAQAVTHGPKVGDRVRVVNWTGPANGSTGVIVRSELAYHAVLMDRLPVVMCWGPQHLELSTSAAVESDGWIAHKPGDPMPCDADALVRVRLEDGTVCGSDHADSRGASWDWTAKAWKIVAWRRA
jgi:hypothetical protein